MRNNPLTLANLMWSVVFAAIAAWAFMWDGWRIRPVPWTAHWLLSHVVGAIFGVGVIVSLGYIVFPLQDQMSDRRDKRRRDKLVEETQRKYGAIWLNGPKPNSEPTAKLQ